MARWKVNAKHYIMAEQYGEPTEWVREETNRDTGRTFRRSYKVPMMIDPDDPLCRNREGLCVVSSRASAHPGDIVLLEPIPGPDMEPIDDEAQQITDEHKHKWINPIDGLPVVTGEEFAVQIMRSLEAQINKIGQQSPINLTGASSNEISELKKLIQAQQSQINQLLNPLSAASAPKPDDVILEDIDPDEPTVPPPARSPRRV